MARRRTHRITINPFGPDCRATAALESVVQPHDQWTRGGEGVHQQAQEQPRSLQAGPDGAVQDTMLGLKGFHVSKAHDSQSGGNGPLSGSQKGPSSQDLGMVPHPLREQGGERIDQRDKLLRHGKPRKPPIIVKVLSLTVPVVYCPKWIKSRGWLQPGNPDCRTRQSPAVRPAP